MGDSGGEHEQPAVYLNAFYSLVKVAVSAISMPPTDASLIEAIMTRKETDNEYLTYITALFTYQPILALVAAVQMMLMIGSFVGGFFFVLARMVGAFGGRKVQNITTQYMHVLQFYSVFMVLFLALNA
ncbi:hypothetical protein V5799_010434 [Amblyomma americanum]|uniref:Uncharacterized protein n=1 Tax=Amblyomma americanum TaxID=6943 RepID=A0AAQ4EK47_AMBAM